MHSIRPTRPPSPEQVRAYREAGLWNDRCLRDGLETAAAQTPSAIAVADANRRLTYAALKSAVTAGVATLRSAGVQPGGTVVLVSGNSVEGVIAYHAILRCGATAIVLDRRCGLSDVQHASRIAGESPVLILPETERERLHDGINPVDELALESFGPIEATPATTASWTEPDRDAPAVILFTSGTTSRPKAVIHSLNTLTAGARNMARITEASRETSAFLVSPLTSITGVMQMHLVADMHATLLLEDQFDDEKTLDRINAEGATLLGGAPVIAERLLLAAENRPDRHIAIRTLALGGAMLPRPLLEVALRDFGIQVARVYGSSESPNATGSVPEDATEQRLIDDGSLMPGTEIRVGSKEYEQEGLIRGPALFLGYVDAADSDAAFEEDWYRSGDAVEVTQNRLTVVGRLKDVVNRNGLKISLAEVEAALAHLPGTLEAACFGVADEATGERLAVAVRLEPGQRTSLEAITTHLQQAGLAKRKLPEQIVVWNGALPRTPSGKIVRSRLVMESAGKTSHYASRIPS